MFNYYTNLCSRKKERKNEGGLWRKSRKEMDTSMCGMSGRCIKAGREKKRREVKGEVDYCGIIFLLRPPSSLLQIPLSPGCIET